MGFFGNKVKEEDKALINSRKYVETFYCDDKEELDKLIANRMEKRIIKDIKFAITSGQSATESCTSFSAMLIYDHFKEKIRDEKEQGIGIER